MTWTSSFYWVTIALFHDLQVSYIDILIIFLPTLSQALLVIPQDYTIEIQLWSRGKKPSQVQCSLLLVNYLYRTIFERLLSVCLLLVIPQECTVQIQLLSRGKISSPFLFFLLFVNYMYRAKFGRLLSICLLLVILYECTVQIQL